MRRFNGVDGSLVGSACWGGGQTNEEKYKTMSSEKYWRTPVLENARIKPWSWRCIFSKKFEFWTTRYDLDGDLFPFSYLHTLQNNNASNSLKVCYQTLILTVCCIIVRRKNLYDCVWYIIQFSWPSS